VQAEAEIARRETVWVRGTTNSLLGTAILTGERLLFFHTKFATTGTGGVLEDMLVGALQRRHEQGGPALEVDLSSITGLRCERKLFARDRLGISTSDGDYLFNDGWKDWAPLIRDTLIAGHARKVVEDRPDAWRVEPA
jgi:hypothetical protein